MGDLIHTPANTLWRHRNHGATRGDRSFAARPRATHGTRAAATLCRWVLSLLLLSGLSAWAAAAPATYDTLLQTGMTERNAGDFLAAERSFRAARELAARTSEVDSLLGMVLAFQGRLDDALALLDDSLQHYPDDPQLLLARARVLSFQGDHAQSLVATQQVLSAQPANLEALLLAGRTSYYQRETNLARTYYLQALDADPGNLDALLGLHDLEADSGNTDAARARLDEAALLAPTAPEVAARRSRQQVAAAGRHSLSSSLGYSNIKGSALSNWHDRSVEYRYTGQQGHQVFLRGESLNRFDMNDSLAELGAVFLWGERQPLEVAVAYGDDADFSPRRRIRLATSLALPRLGDRLGSTLLDIAYADAEYVVGNVTQTRLGITHYFKGFDGWFNTGALRVRDENRRTTTGWTAGMHWQATARTRLGYAFTDAPETENNLTTETRTHHLYASLQLTRALELRLDGSRNDRQNSFARESINLSVQFRF